MKQGWEIKKLGEVCDILDHLRVPITKKDRREGVYPYYGASGVQDYVDSYIFDGRYLLVGEDGAKWGANDKSAYIIEGKSWVNNHAHILKLNENVSDRLVEYYLVSKDLSEYITGAVVPKLTQQALRSIPIPIPPLPEQEKIVAELDCLSGIIEKKREQLKELDALAQSIFYTMFGDPITNEKGWEVDRLGNLCDISSSKRIYAHEYCDNGIPFYRGKEISEKSKGNDISVELYISEERYNELKNKFGVPQIGDILLTAVGTIGNIWVVDSCTPFYFKDGNVLWLQAKENINPIYFKTLLYNLIDKYKESMANGCAYSALTIVNLKEMKTNKVPYTLQQEFADKIALIEKQKQLIKESIAQTEELFNSRMAYYFN